MFITGQAGRSVSHTLHLGDRSLTISNRLDIEERRSWLSILILLLSDFQLEQRLDLQVALQTCIMSLLEADRTPLELAVTVSLAAIFTLQDLFR